MECHGLQCGFCTPGMLMASACLLAETPRPGEAQIVHALEGNAQPMYRLCEHRPRCRGPPCDGCGSQLMSALSTDPTQAAAPGRPTARPSGATPTGGGGPTTFGSGKTVRRIEDPGAGRRPGPVHRRRLAARPDPSGLPALAVCACPHRLDRHRPRRSSCPACWPSTPARSWSPAGVKPLDIEAAASSGPTARRPRFAPRRVLALDVVRFTGEPVVAVVAETVDAGPRGGRRAIWVEYDELPAVTDPLRAVQAGAPVIWPPRRTTSSRSRATATPRRPKPPSPAAAHVHLAGPAEPAPAPAPWSRASRWPSRGPPPAGSDGAPAAARCPPACATRCAMLLDLRRRAACGSSSATSAAASA